MPGEEAIDTKWERTISERSLQPKQWVVAATDDDDDPPPATCATGPPRTLSDNP
jgi:hypothetical protein